LTAGGNNDAEIVTLTKLLVWSSDKFTATPNPLKKGHRQGNQNILTISSNSHFGCWPSPGEMCWSNTTSTQNSSHQNAKEQT
jgi:hypothetical protein